MSEFLTISEAAKEVGLSTHTLRYYERAGLLDSITRTTGGIRMYHRENLDFLRFLSRLRKTGMSIATTRRYANMVREGRETMHQRHQLLLDHKAEVESQIATLQKFMGIINLKLDLYAQDWSNGDEECQKSEELRSLLNEK